MIFLAILQGSRLDQGHGNCFFVPGTFNLTYADTRCLYLCPYVRRMAWRITVLINPGVLLGVFPRCQLTYFSGLFVICLDMTYFICKISRSCIFRIKKLLIIAAIVSMVVACEKDSGDAPGSNGIFLYAGIPVDIPLEQGKYIGKRFLQSG